MRRDKRKNPRGPVSATAVLLDKGKPVGSHRILNLSSGGALLVGRAPMKHELEALVRLSTGRTVRAKATIARQEGAGDAAVFAVAFTQVAAADQKVIGKLVLTALEDARDASALIVAAVPEACKLLRRALTSLGHSSFVVGTREDALRFLEAPNVLTVAFVDLSLPRGDAAQVLATLQDEHPQVRRVAMAGPAKTTRGTARTRKPPAAQAILPAAWTRASLVGALGD